MDGSVSALVPLCPHSCYLTLLVLREAWGWRQRAIRGMHGVYDNRRPLIWVVSHEFAWSLSQSVYQNRSTGEEELLKAHCYELNWFRRRARLTCRWLALKQRPPHDTHLVGNLWGNCCFSGCSIAQPSMKTAYKMHHALMLRSD